MRKDVGGRADMHFGGRIWNKENGLESKSSVGG